MRARRLFRLLTSARATVALLCLLALLLLLTVALPQAALVGADELASRVENRPVLRFLLVGLGMGRMSTSPLFLTVLGLFFLNLALVLGSRLAPTWRRMALRPRAEDGLIAWARRDSGSRSAPLPEEWGTGLVVRVLRGYGFQTRRAGERTFWGVKHRTAPAGFLLFHASFFLLCAGGALIYYTRFVAVAVLSEGQELAGEYTSIERLPPWGDEPELRFVLKEVRPRFERGEPVHLGAVFGFRRGGALVERHARVNEPARWGATSVLVNEAGLSPVLWLQDAQGVTLDRVVIPMNTRGGEPTEVALGDGELLVSLEPLGAGVAFPSRERRAETRLSLRVLQDGEELFVGALKQGEAGFFAGRRIVLQELRYWVAARVVSERGGGLLIAGFALAIAGLLWRLPFCRREVALTWDEGRFFLVGRSEYFSRRFDEELDSMFAALAGWEGSSEEPRSEPSGNGG